MGFWKLVGATARVGFGAGCILTKGAIGLTRDAVRVGGALASGNLDKAGEVVVNRAAGMVAGAVGTVQAAALVLDHAEECARTGKDFFDRDTTRNLSQLTAVGLGAFCGLSATHALCASASAVAGLDGMDGFDAADAGDSSAEGGAEALAFEPSTLQLEFADGQGYFHGDEDALIAAGEHTGTTHIDSDDIDRSMAARNAFLEHYGHDGVPEGYEVHHIVPLCEGGPDTPDNMILVSDDLHDRITAAHRAYYGWNA